MRTLCLTAATAIAAAAFATPAMAQDATPFTGPHIGVTAGWDRIQPGSTVAQGDDHVDGVEYGVDAGYDIAAGSNAVIGIEGEVAGSTGHSNRDLTNGYTGYGRVKPGRDLYIGARAGYVVSPGTMLYAKAGYTNARLDLTASDGTTETGNHFNLDGYRVGAGVERQFGNGLYGKVEYRYSNYGNARFEYPNGTNTNNFDVDTDRHQVVVGVGMHF